MREVCENARTASVDNCSSPNSPNVSSVATLNVGACELVETLKRGKLSSVLEKREIKWIATGLETFVLAARSSVFGSLPRTASGVRVRKLS